MFNVHGHPRSGTHYLMAVLQINFIGVPWEKPLEGVTSQLILDSIGHPNKRIVNKSQVVSSLDPTEIQVIATIGAGDIDQLVLPIKQKLTA